MNIDDYLFGYAMLDNTDHVVEIDEFNKETCSQHKFSCPFCNGEMYPTYGRVQRHHFRHNGNKCNRDDYLHSLAEHVFKEEFLKCIEQDTPFVLELHTPVYCSRSCLNIKSGKCSTRENIIYIDLAKRYRSITVEKNITVGDHYRRPDILLISEDGEQLWVEIWVKHETVLEKRQEGQILEIKISSEKDIEQIRNHKVVSEVNNSAVRLFNSVINQGRGVFKKSIVDTESCTDIKTIPKAPQIQYSSKPAFRKNYYKEIQRSYSEHLPSFDEKKVEWIDLGLPSGTLWAKNDQEETISFKNARFLYKYYLPSKEQFEELCSYCKQEWNSDTKELVFIGKNGNRIPFPAESKVKIYWLNKYCKEDGKTDYNYGQCFRVVWYDEKWWFNNEEISEREYIRLSKGSTEAEDLML